MKAKLKSRYNQIDKVFLFLTLGLTFFGILMIFNSSSVMAQETFKDKFYLARSQFFWAILSLVILSVTSFIDYHFWLKYSFHLFVFSLFLLVLVLIPGIGVKLLGGQRWLRLGSFIFQPAEWAKVTSLLYATAFFEKEKVNKFLSFLILSGLLAFLLILEPDLGTAIILLGTIFVIYFVSGAGFWQVLTTVFLGVAVMGVFIVTSPYRFSRFKVFLNPNLDPEGASYHVRQIFLALGSGGIWGRGLGQSRQKFLYLPEVATDSIFAVIAEEFGFLGATGLLMLFLFYFILGLKIALRAPDTKGQLLGIGIISMIFIQTFLNLASIVSLLPLTGVPLPFISYGGSSLVTVLFSVGILLNISRFVRKGV